MALLNAATVDEVELDPAAQPFPAWVLLPAWSAPTRRPTTGTTPNVIVVVPPLRLPMARLAR